MPGTYSIKHYVNIDLNYNDLQNAIIGSGSYINRPIPNGISDKGLFYYDTFLSHLMVWNGTRWEICKYLSDNNSYEVNNNVLFDDVWTQTNLIPNNPGTTTSAVYPLVTEYVNITLSHVPNTYTFIDNTNQLVDVIPSKFGTIYNPVIYDYNDSIIPTNFLNYQIHGNSVTFYDGFTFSSSIIGPTQTPSISFIKYIGSRGTFYIPSADLSVISITGMSYPYDVIGFPFPYSSTPSNTNSLLFINGVMEYDWSFNPTSSQVTIFTSSIGYPVEFDDEISIHYKP